MTERPFRVAFLADTQLGMFAQFSGLSDADVVRYAEMDMRVRAVPTTTGFEWDARNYERAVAQVNGLRPDLVMVGGDMIDDPNSDSQTEAFFAITARIDDGIPVRYAPGNHDIAPDTVVPTPDSIDQYRDRFGPDHYVLESGPLTFVVLNTVLIDHPELAPSSWARQETFLDETFDQMSPEARVVAVGHHPLFLADPDEPDNYWNLPRERRRPLYDRLRAGGVRLAIAGHWHRNNVVVHDGFEMVTSGPVGYPLGTDPSGMRILDVYQDRIAHRYLPLSD